MIPISEITEWRQKVGWVSNDLGPLLREEDNFDMESAFEYLIQRLFNLLPE